MNLDRDLPLQGKNIVVTRAQDQQALANKLFDSKGARVLDLPALVIGPPDEWIFLDNALATLCDFHWIIFSSTNGVDAVETRLKLLGNNLSCIPKSLKIAAVGRKTAQRLKSLGACPDFTPPNFVADSLVENFPVSAMGLRILLPRVQTGGREYLAREFREAGAEVVEVPAYESNCPMSIPEATAQAFLKRKVNVITFTSGKTVKNTSKLFFERFGMNWRDLFEGVLIVSIGPQTTIACKKYFNRVNKEAYPYDLEGLVNACIDLFEN